MEGSPLDWDESLDWLQHVREHGIAQFLHIYERVKDIEGDELKWGDELEYGVFKMDEATRQPKLSLRGAEILAQLKEKEEKHAHAIGGDGTNGCSWVPEYGAWMIEGTPRVPYGGFTSDLRKVESNMRIRRARLMELLHSDEIAPTVTAFPIMGVKDFTDPPTKPHGDVALSDYVSDDVINPHPRFATLTRNIRKRRTRKVDIRVPLFKDVYTKAMLLEEKASWNAEKSRPKYESKKESTGSDSSAPSSPLKPGAANGHASSNGEAAVTGIDKDCHAMSKSPSNEALEAFDGENYVQSRRKISTRHAVEQAEPYPGVIHMDCMAFGMGMCCLQVTFQAKNIGESRHLYDHLNVLSPIMLALTAATPILKGRLADTDVRWATISAAVDDRTPQELGDAELPTDPETRAKYAKMAGNGSKRLPKSRYEGISTYICNHKHGEDPHSSTDKYNDVDVPYDEASYETLRASGVDHLLALHISHLFIRDPLVIYKQRLHLDDEKETDHFENIQSTNWQTVRWKPPPPRGEGEELKPHIGWRTEFRSMEIQLTDFENAAYSVFIALVSRVILTFDLNLYTPLSKVNENMEAAHRVNAVLDEKFYFRCHLAPPEKDDCASGNATCGLHQDPDSCEPMTIAEIMLGKGAYFPGLIPLVYAYLDYIECDEATRQVVSRYLCLIAKRATGELPTAATWMRRFVRAHPDYLHDSVVSSSIAYDLLKECQAIGEGERHCPELLGEFKIEPVRGTAAYQVPLKSDGVEASMRQKLLQRYIGRTTAAGVCDGCQQSQ